MTGFNKLTYLSEFGLNDRQMIFVSEYTQHWNGVRAAETAGYSNPKVMGPRLLNKKLNPKIHAAIASIQNTNLETAILTRDAIVQELSSLAMRDIIELCDKETGTFYIDDMRKIPPHIRRSIDGLTVEEKHDEDGNVIERRMKFTLAKKLEAFDMLMKHFGMYAPQEHNVKHGVDWDSLFEDNQEDVDVIEGEIAKLGKK